MTEVHWFGHGHEDRNDWLRFGFMRLHAARKIHFQEHSLADASQFGFDREVVGHTHRHTSVVAVRTSSKTVRVLIDSEDSFFWISPMIDHVDLYFCAGYNRAFFEEQRFTSPLTWQSEQETAFYHRRAGELFDRHGHSFGRVRRHCPIGPNLSIDQQQPWVIQKARNLYHRASSNLRRSTPWLLRFLAFESRYRQLLALRNSSPLFDVVLHDTLWGWPRHRLRLHEHLADISAKGFNVHSRLRWNEPVSMDGGASYSLDKSRFPIETGSIGNYEQMLSASRVGVFATGFHYGWRNIVTLCMMWGLPIYSDPFLIEHTWDHRDYTFAFNASGDWKGLQPLLERFNDNDRLSQTKLTNQRLFDQHLAPEVVASHFLADVMADSDSHSRQGQEPGTQVEFGMMSAGA